MLELVNSQCKNQGYKHWIKQSQSGSNNSIVDSSSGDSTQSSSVNRSTKTSQNNWLSKKFTQFKEATNQVVQKFITNNGEN